MYIKDSDLDLLKVSSDDLREELIYRGSDYDPIGPINIIKELERRELLKDYRRERQRPRERYLANRCISSELSDKLNNIKRLNYEKLKAAGAPHAELAKASYNTILSVNHSLAAVYQREGTEAIVGEKDKLYNGLVTAVRFEE